MSNRTALAMVVKLLEAAQKTGHRLDGHNQLPKLVLGVTFNNGIEVIAKPTDRQPITAAAYPARPSPKFSDSSVLNCLRFSTQNGRLARSRCGRSPGLPGAL